MEVKGGWEDDNPVSGDVDMMVPVTVLYHKPLEFSVPLPASEFTYGVTSVKTPFPSVESEVEVVRRFLPEVAVTERSLVGDWSE